MNKKKCQRKLSFSMRSCVCKVLIIPLTFGIQTGYSQTSITKPPITETILFNTEKLQLNAVVGENQKKYTQLSYTEGTTIDGIPGQPALPSKYIQLIVPNDVDYSDITIQASSTRKITLSSPIYPAQNPVRLGEQTNKRGFEAGDPSVYNSKDIFNDKVVKYVNEGYFDGNKHVITLQITPVQYFPSESYILFYTSITFSVNATDKKQLMHSINKVITGSNEVPYKNALNDLPTYNKLEIPPSTNVNELPTGGGKVPFYEYVIITSHDLIPAFQELLGWKREKGLNAGIVDIQDILNSPDYANGDLVSNINDNAGKLRAYLKDAYGNGGTVYALLGGDETVIPTRYATENYGGPEKMVADLYYTDFNGNWNVNSNQYYGENGFSSNDAVDFHPEIFVGRMLVRTAREAYNHIYKVIRYERGPGRGDYDYLSNAYITQADQLLQSNEAGIISAQMTVSPMAINAFVVNEQPSATDPNPTGPMGDEVIAQVGSNKYGWITFDAHGGPWGTPTATGGIAGNPFYGPTSLDAVPPGAGQPDVTGNGLDNLDDYDYRQHPYQNYPLIVYNPSCSTIPMDLPPNNPSNIYKQFGSAFTNVSIAGAAAYLSNTGSGWTWFSTQLYKKFLQRLILTGENQRAGIAEALSKVDYIGSGLYTWLDKAHHLIGCPEMPVWIKKPLEFKNVQISGGQGTVNVSTAGEEATICITSALDNGDSYQQVFHNVSTATFTGVPQQYTVCITKPNFIPYLSGQTINIQDRIFLGTAYIGRPNIETGNPDAATPAVVVKSGANVFFHADQEIILNAGFCVESGGTFEAK